MSNAFQSVAEEITKLEIDTLERSGDTFNFTDVHHLTATIHHAASYLSAPDADMSLIDANAREHIKSWLEEFQDICHRIQHFDVKDGNPNDTRTI